MTDTSAAVPGGIGTPAMIIGGGIITAMLGALGFAAIHIPGALSSPGASAPEAPPNPIYAPPTSEDQVPSPESPVTDDPAEQGNLDDSDDALDEEQTENTSGSESDDSPDRDSDRNGDSWLREPDGLDTDTVYRIREGDTLASISDDVGVSVDMLASYNDITNVDVIYKRSSLVIPYSEVNIADDFADE